RRSAQTRFTNAGRRRSMVGSRARCRDSPTRASTSSLSGRLRCVRAPRSSRTMLAADVARDPWSPRPIDLPTAVPLAPTAELTALDGAKILAAPDDPADWPAWRDALRRWRSEAARRIDYDGSAYERPELAWTERCFAVALVWLWDELLYDHAAGRFTVDRLCADAERFGGFDGIV